MQLTMEKVSKIYLETARLFNHYLNSSDQKCGREYLEERGISLELANKYLFGYIPTGFPIWENLVVNKKFSPEDLILSKLLRINIDTKEIDEYFSPNKIIMPIFENNNIISFSSRSLLENYVPKYKTLKYNKMGIFNIDVIKEEIPFVYVTEGIIDAVTLIHLGFPSIGILGLNNFGKEYLDPFKSFEGTIVLLFDNDKNGAGLRGVQDVGNLLLKNGNKVYYKMLPKPDDVKKIDINQLYVTHGIYKTQLIINALPLIDIPIVKKQQQERIKEKCNLNIYNVISKYMELRPESNGRFRGLCPFSDHNDSSPSFVVYEDSNFFKCYGCGRRGNAITFLMELKGISYSEALMEANK